MSSPIMDIPPVLAALQSVLAGFRVPVALHEPRFAGNEWTYVKECLDTGWVSSVGSFVDRFEAKLAEFTGVKRAVVTMNGTAALHMCLLLAGVKPGDEVLVPALTFVATANAVTYCHAEPHFVDIEESTLGVGPAKLEAYLSEIIDHDADGPRNRRTGRPVRALVVMHTFGHPADLDALTAICSRYGITLIEDAAESMGSRYKGRHTGNWGRLSALSFNGNKTMTTGGGGAILTNDSELGALAKHLTTTAKMPHRWEFIHDHIGYNYRLPNLNAALGCAQMEQLPGFLKRKRALADLYRQAFVGVAQVRFFIEPPGTESNYWLNTLLLDRDVSVHRDRLLEVLHDAGIMARPAWRLMNQLPMFAACPAMDLSTSQDLQQRIINIPSSPILGPDCA